MSRTISPSMATHLAGRAHTRCTMLRLDLRDGTSIGITDHDRNLTFNLGDGAITYSAATGILASDVSLATGLDADNYEVTGPIADVVTLEALLGGRFDRAEARLFQVNHRNLSQGAIALMKGNVTEARPEGGRFVLEVRNQFDRYNQTVCRTITNICNADYGDARCKATPETIVATVTAVTSAMIFSVSYTGTYADDYFNHGTVEALTGDMVGTLPVDIFKWNETAAGAADVELFMPLVEDPAVGETFTVKRGCPRTRAACMARNNIVNFRGYPELPGTDQVLRPTVPGQGNAN